MTSPLVTRLEVDLRVSIDPVERAMKSAQLACYLARVGEFEEAERRRTELRQHFGDGRSPRVSIMIMCLEALLLYFKDLDPTAHDRLLRANLISVACHERALVALTSAWLAHIEFNRGYFESMAKATAHCLETLDADDGTADCRISLVLGDAFAFTGQDEVSRLWYERARLLATKLGDQAAIGALTYNRAALHVAGARIHRLRNSQIKPDISLVGAEVRSAINYQAVAQLSSLDHLLRSATVGVLVLGDRFEEASHAIKLVLESSTVPAGTAEHALLYADYAHCEARLGNFGLARQMLGAAVAIRSESFDADDRARIFGALRGFSEAIGEAGAADAYLSAQEAALDEHSVTVASLAKLLEPFSTASPSQSSALNRVP